jgi:hypothetical protein
MTKVNALFEACKHERVIDVSIEDDVKVPPQVRGLGLCPDCMEEDNVVPVAGIAPQPGGREVVVDSILMMPI